MPAALIWIIGGAVALLAAGEGLNLGGQGAQTGLNAVNRTMLLSAALYLGYVALKAK